MALEIRVWEVTNSGTRDVPTLDTFFYRLTEDRNEEDICGGLVFVLFLNVLSGPIHQQVKRGRLQTTFYLWIQTIFGKAMKFQYFD